MTRKSLGSLVIDTFFLPNTFDTWLADFCRWGTCGHRGLMRLRVEEAGKAGWTVCSPSNVRRWGTSNQCWIRGALGERVIRNLTALRSPWELWVSKIYHPREAIPPKGSRQFRRWSSGQHWWTKGHYRRSGKREQRMLSRLWTTSFFKEEETQHHKQGEALNLQQCVKLAVN